MGQSIHRLSFGNAGCALSVQKKMRVPGILPADTNGLKPLPVADFTGWTFFNI